MPATVFGAGAGGAYFGGRLAEGAAFVTRGDVCSIQLYLVELDTDRGG